MKKLFITNTLTRQKEQFIPLHEKQVLMYVCGITPYDYAHIGHGRVYVTFDIIYRLLSFLGYKVTYCRNFTDIDDKLINKAAKELNDPMRYQEVAQKFIAAYHQDMANLACLPPDYEPYVTQTIPEIINFITGLINNKKAYVINGSVYYRVSSFKDYGKLSKQNLDELESGARVEIDPEKQSPLDFALWKAEDEHHFWQSPWGWGRPGWHIECSAMASKYLGQHIDLHAGGRDLIFPHHENEIAQSEGLYGAPFAKYWMHNAFVQINKEKMSKSLNNFFTLKDVFAQIDPMVLRYYFANHNYGTPLDFNLEELPKIQKSYNRLCLALEQSDSSTINQNELATSPIVQKLLTYLCDDLNSSGMFGAIFENLSSLSALEKAYLKAFLQQIMGLSMTYIPEKQATITPQIQALIDQRQQARANKNWAEADRLRQELTKLGITVQDK
jgi:cysteinyl-tRNA synthetase